MARVQNAYKIQRLWPNCCSGRRVPTFYAMLKNYRKYGQHGTSVNRNKVNSSRYLQFLVTLLSKEKLKIKSLGFSQFLSDFEKLGLKI